MSNHQRKGTYRNNFLGQMCDRVENLIRAFENTQFVVTVNRTVRWASNNDFIIFFWLTDGVWNRQCKQIICA